MEAAFVPAGCGNRTCGARNVAACATRRDFLRVATATTASLITVALPFASSAKKPKLITLDSGVEYTDIKEGKGNSPVPGDLVIVNYVGYLSDGTVFDNSESPGRKPLAFRFGQKQVIPGWEEGMVNMKPGGVRELKVPPELAYGKRGVCLEDQGCLIPPNETLKYEIKLLRVAISPI